MKHTFFTIFAWTSISVLAFAEDLSLASEVRSQVAEYAKSGGMIGAVTLVAKGNEIIDLQAHGVRNLDSREPVLPSTIFKIHSFTKAITSCAALMLHEEGKFKFDEPVFKWLPEFATLSIQTEKETPVPARNPILVKHLFTHTSGINYKHRDVFKAGNLEAVIKALAAKPLSFEPGESWEYGMSIDVLGRLIEIWSGRDFADYLDEMILRPLGMVDTAFFVPTDKMDRRITLYSSSKGDGNDFTVDPENKEVPATKPEFCMPGGGLYSTATDYFHFLRMIQNGGEWNGKQYLKPETHRLMVTNQVADSIRWIRFGKEVRDGFGYGYGFNTVVRASEWDPAARVGECGWGGAASCHYWFDPASKITVVTLEQIKPYRSSLEPVLKGVIYRMVK